MQFTPDAVEALVVICQSRIDPIESLVVLVQVFVHAPELIEHQAGEALNIRLRHMRAV